nr:hypothetical protein [Pedobacter panaciterrae]
MSNSGNLVLIAEGLGNFKRLMSDLQHTSIDDIDGFFDRSQKSMRILLDQLYVFIYQDEVGAEARRAVALRNVWELFDESTSLAELFEMRSETDDEFKRENEERNLLACLLMDKTDRIMKAIRTAKPSCLKKK